MNNIRRKQLQDIYNSLEDLQATLNALRDEEQDYIDNVPENLQGSDKVSNAEDAVYAMEEADEYISSAMDQIEDAIAC